MESDWIRIVNHKRTSRTNLPVKLGWCCDRPQLVCCFLCEDLMRVILANGCKMRCLFFVVLRSLFYTYLQVKWSVSSSLKLYFKKLMGDLKPGLFFKTPLFSVKFLIGERKGTNRFLGFCLSSTMCFGSYFGDIHAYIIHLLHITELYIMVSVPNTRCYFIRIYKSICHLLWECLSSRQHSVELLFYELLSRSISFLFNIKVNVSGPLPPPFPFYKDKILNVKDFLNW